MSMADDIHDAITQLATDLELTFMPGGKLLSVLKRKVPVVEEGDPLPCLLVCRSQRGERVEPVGFEGYFSVTYEYDFVFVAVGDRDYLSNLPDYRAWRQAVETTFARPVLPTIDQVWDTTVIPDVEIDAGKLGRNFDFGTIGVDYAALEQRFTNP